MPLLVANLQNPWISKLKTLIFTWILHISGTFSNNSYLRGHCCRMRVTFELLRSQNFSYPMLVEFPGEIHHVLRPVQMWHTVSLLCVGYSYRPKIICHDCLGCHASTSLLGGCHWYIQGGAASPAPVSRNICQCGHLDLRCYCKKAACEKASFQTLWMQQLFYKGFILISL